MTSIIDIRQIALTPPIMEAIVRAGGNVPEKSPKPKFIASGVPLYRMDRMMSLSSDAFDTLLETDPIQLIPLKATIDGPQLFRMIDDKKLPLYDIINGRHRVARAIIDGKTHIQAHIN